MSVNNVVLPAEAPLDLYKAAYVYYKRFNLRLCNFIFAYPNKSFNVSRNDVMLGMHVNTGGRDVEKYMRFDEVMDTLGGPIEFKFLYQIPEDVFYGFRNRDKTVVLSALFEYFDNYTKSIAELSGADEILAAHTVHEVGDLRIVVQNPKEFITPDERIILFKNGYHYVVFVSEPSVGIQKNLSKRVPTLSGFAEVAGLRSGDWFVHRRGHLIVSRSAKMPDMNMLIEQFIKYLSETNNT